MDVTLYLDGDPTVREEGFFEAKVFELNKQIKDLQFTLAELTTENEQLKERVTQLATRQPQWPKGYRPRRYNPQGDKKPHQRYERK